MGDSPDPDAVPQALYFSSAAAGGNASWTQRTLKSASIVAGAAVEEQEGVESFYEIMGAGRFIEDDPTSGQ